MAANVDTCLWLHNKLGTSNTNDSWTSGSICSQLNKEVLKNIKDCFPDLQTQVKLKLLLSFFHIPRRHVEEWKKELEEIIEVAGLDSELWVSMVAETMKTFPATGSLNTEISDYDETRPIFTDMVNDLKKLVNKHSDLCMLPLECQYLNKAALISVVGQQSPPVKHFTLKRKPKSVQLRAELLQKSSDAQSTLKKASAPTIPLRSRGMPRKMTDTTPLKGIPSRMPTCGFRSPTAGSGLSRPNLSRTPAGRKDGGIKLLDIADQPLGYAAAKKRKRQMELEEQQKKAEAMAAATASGASSTPTSSVSSSTPDYAAGLTASAIYTQPATPASSLTASVKETPLNSVNSVTSGVSKGVTGASVISTSSIVASSGGATPKHNVMEAMYDMKQVMDCKADSPTEEYEEIVTSPTTPKAPKMSTKLITSATIVSQAPSLVKAEPTSHIPAASSTVTSSPQSGGAQVISQTVISSPMSLNMPALTVFSSPSAVQGSHIVRQEVPSGGQTVVVSQASTASPQQFHQIAQMPKIVQIKTAPTIMMGPSNTSSIPPLIPSQPHQVIGSSHITTPTSNVVTLVAGPQTGQTQTLGQTAQIVTGQGGQKFAVMSAPNVKGKTFILTNPGMLAQKGVIIKSVAPGGNTIYQQIPISNVSGLQNLTGTTILTGSPAGIIKTSGEQSGQATTATLNQIPALVPTRSISQNIPSLTPVVIAPQNQQQNIPALITNVSSLQQQNTIQSPQGTIIRPVLATNMQGLNVLNQQGYTLIQRPGGQPTLIQAIPASQATVQQAQQAPSQQQAAQIQRSATVQAVQQPGQPRQVQSAQPIRKGLSLSSEHVNKVHEMFRGANRVTRLDKALILGFISGQRENPRPNPDNVVTITLNQTKEKVKQEDDTDAVMLVESFIRLDYNTMEYKTFQKYRRLDQPATHDNQKVTSASGSTQSSVAI
ncbi:negative elongation factor A [Phlebotomus argentipes]|uniref:negative elongation factor A n=1 Tax=Phlebotomus argentipes TaxID=94469 RepID=UPI002892AD36|nr:negative elongation factor A [Phlebotomus argentipes]